MKALFIVVPILLFGGALGAAFMGVISIPGITPKKTAAAKSVPKEQQATGDESTATDSVEDQQVTADTNAQEPPTEPSRAVSEPKPITDPELGAKALAKYWDEIEVTKLIAITETYKEPELAQVLFFMQKSKVAELLGSVSSERAARLSRELQRLASVVKVEAL
jgi:hypothetical protein